MKKFVVVLIVIMVLFGSIPALAAGPESPGKMPVALDKLKSATIHRPLNLS